MRRLVQLALFFCASLLLAFSFLAANGFFEAAGGVPDAAGWRLLTGNRFLEAIIFFGLSMAAANRTAWYALHHALARRFLPVFGAALGTAGSALYFGVGLRSAPRFLYRQDVPLTLWLTSALFVLLCAAGGTAGAWRIMRKYDAAALEKHRAETDLETENEVGTKSLRQRDD